MAEQRGKSSVLEVSVILIAITVLVCLFLCIYLVGAATWGNLFRETEHALKFDGQSSHVVIPGLHYEGDYPVTIEAWVKPEDLSTERDILSDCQNAGIGVGFKRGGKCAFGIHNGRGYVTAWSDEPAVPGEEAHIAGVFDGEFLTLFVEGKVQEIPASFQGRPKPSPLQPMIGANPEAAGHIFAFQGWIDEVRISRIARYTATFVPERRFEPDEDTVALYHFDEGEGDMAHDSSGNNRHGRIRGAEWVQLH